MGPPPVVTGISPKEGPPGTRVTIRGEFLGATATDLVGLKICGCDCFLSAEWKSRNKIVARSGPGKGRGDIVVTTRAGGEGTSTVQFRGYHESVGPMKESAVWVEEAAPAAPWGRRPMSPVAYTPPDPLGLATDGDECKFPEEELQELFPEGSADLADENFEPGRYLLEHHSNTSFEDLMAGAAFLQRKVEGQKEGQLSFLKDNAGEVIDRLDRLLQIKTACDEDRDNARRRLADLQAAIQEAISLSNGLFSEVLSRARRVEQTRAALTLLTRHKFLFQLPATIDANVRKQDYDLVVNDYARVRNLFGGSEVKVFQKILTVIDKKIEDLKETLHAKIINMPIGIQEQRKLIRLLISLGREGDAAWDAIGSRREHLLLSLNELREHFRRKEGDVAPEGCWSGGRAEWCAAACALLAEHMSALWSLGRWYFAGELGGAAAEQAAGAADVHRRYKDMILESVELFASHMRECLLSAGSAPPDAVRARLAASLRDLRHAHDTLHRLDLPSQPLSIIETVISAYRVHGMTVFLQAALERVRALRDRETWQVETFSDYGAVTKLPRLLQSHVLSALSNIRECALPPHRRAPAEALAALHASLADILGAYTRVLRDLPQEEEFGGNELSAALERAPEEEPEAPPAADAPPPPPAWRVRLLMAASNAQHTRAVVLPALAEAALRLALPLPEPVLENTSAELAALEARLLDAYLEHVGDPLVGTIEPSMYLCRSPPARVTDARPYVYEIVDNLVTVHAEVESVCGGAAARCVRDVCETVCEELARLAACAPPPAPAALAAAADHRLLQLAMQAHLSRAARNYLKEAMAALPPLRADDDRKLDTIVNSFKKRMELQLPSLNYNTEVV